MTDDNQFRSNRSMLASAVLVLSAISSGPLNGQALPASTWRAEVVHAPNGPLFVLGTLGGRDLPTAVVQANPLGACDVSGPSIPFLAKVAPAGDRIVWATYLCAGVRSMVADSVGDLYLAGTIRGPGLSIVKLSSDGKSLLASTSVSAQFDPSIAALALQLDATANVYVAKNASSADIPVTRPRLEISRPPPSNYCRTGDADQFVAKFDASLGKLLFSIRIGSIYPTYPSILAVGSDGTSYIVGSGGEGPMSPCSAWFTLTRLSPDGVPVYAVAHLGYVPTGLGLGRDETAYLGLRSGLARALSPPLGTVWKFDARGMRVASQNLGGSAYRLRAGASGELDVIGDAWPRYLIPTPGGTPACVPSDQFQRNSQPYVARLSSDTLELLYAGFLPGWSAAWFAGSEQLVAARVYSTSESLSPLAAKVSVGSLSLMSLGPPPAGTITCVTNAASQDPRSVAPGEIVSIYGYEIGPAEPLTAHLGADGNLLSELGGTQVSVDGLAAPLLYAGAHQINAVVPFGMSPDRTARLEIRGQGVPIDSLPVKVTAQHPGLFMADWNNNFLAALNQDGTVNSSANRASPGTVVSIFATGLGAMTPPPVDGSHPPQPVSRPVLMPGVWANWQPATVEYIGNAPGLVQGLVQINVRVPAPLNWAVGIVDLGIGPGGLPPVAFGTVWVR